VTSLGESPLTDAHLSWLHHHAQSQLRFWDQELRAAGVPLSRAVHCGSLQTGLLERAKPARYSGSPTAPPRPTIIELDARLILHENADALNPDLLRLIAAKTCTTLARSNVIIRWDRKIPMAVPLQPLHPRRDDRDRVGGLRQRRTILRDDALLE
jgi:hypothetical protein